MLLQLGVLHKFPVALGTFLGRLAAVSEHVFFQVTNGIVHFPANVALASLQSALLALLLFKACSDVEFQAPGGPVAVAAVRTVECLGLVALLVGDYGELRVVHSET